MHIGKMLQGSCNGQKGFVQDHKSIENEQRYRQMLLLTINIKRSVQQRKYSTEPTNNLHNEQKCLQCFIQQRFCIR